MAGLGHRFGFGTIGVIFLMAALLFMFFVVLGGVKHSTPLTKTYFLQADTSGVANARAQSQWNYFYVCGAGNFDCGDAVPALPLGYAWVGGGDGAPDALRGSHAKSTTSTYYYYMWRFGWVFYLMGLVFAGLGLLASGLYLISNIINKFAGLLCMFGLFWYSLGIVLMTVVFVKMRNRFHDIGRSAKLGKYAFGFSWAAWFCLLIACAFFFHAGRKRDAYAASSRRNRNSTGSGVINGGSTKKGSRFNFYRRQKHVAADSPFSKETAV